MNDDIGVCESTTVAGFCEKVSEAPPRRGRAAGGGTISRGTPKAGPTTGKLPKGTVWVAITYLGGPNCRYRLQIGKVVRYVEGLQCLHDAVSCVTQKHSHP